MRGRTPSLRAALDERRAARAPRTGGLRRLRASALAWLVVAHTAAFAADTGTISGVVFDAAGQPVADAIVRVTGEALAVGRTTQTGANGIYRFEYLLPGRYELAIEKTGLGRVVRQAVVEVGRDTQADVVLGALQQEVTVTAATPLVDTRSTEVGSNFRAEEINSLPLERSYRALLQLLPGVADNRSPVGVAAGGSRQDNMYLMDGVNITNPGYGYLSTEVNELDIAEVNLKRAGISAEFGRAAGVVTNAVSRSGSNRLSAIGRLDWMPSELVGGYELPADLLERGVQPGTFRDPVLAADTSAALGVGGPVVRDRVFFYGSARYFRRSKWDRFNKAGTPLPDEVRSGPELFAKINAAPAAMHQLTGSYRHRPEESSFAGLTSDTAPSLATTTDNGSRIGSAEWAHFFGAQSALQVRYLHFSERNEDTPIVDLGYLPPFDPNNLPAMGQFTDASQGNLIVGASQFTHVQNYQRNEVRAVFTRYFDTRAASHALKAGVGFEAGEETFNRVTNGWGAITTITRNNAPALRARYFTRQPAQIGQARTWSAFVQDNVTLAHRTTVTAGLLVTRDEFAQDVDGSGGCPASVSLRGGAAVYESDGDRCTFLRFGFGDEIQPRLGVSYQVRDGRGDKAYVNWGRYYNMDQKSTARSLAPARIFQTQTEFDLSGNVLSSAPLASTTGKLIDPEIEPIYSDELLVGYATPLGSVYSIDVYFVSRETKTFIEDLPSRLNGPGPTAGPFVAANLPCTAFEACRAADAERTYRAVTVDARRRLAGGWAANVSYTWSRFEGNFDLDYAAVAVFNTSSIIQDGPGVNVEDPYRFGPLAEDRPHVFKVLASFVPLDAVALSAYLRVQSGTPWAARARDWAGGVLNYLEPAGSHRNPTWTNLDLMAAYRLRMPAGLRGTLEARLMNVFDHQARLSTDDQQYLDLPDEFFGPYEQPNPWFGTGDAFAPPRRLALSLTLDL